MGSKRGRQHGRNEWKDIKNSEDYKKIEDREGCRKNLKNTDPKEYRLVNLWQIDDI